MDWSKVPNKEISIAELFFHEQDFLFALVQSAILLKVA